MTAESAVCPACGSSGHKTPTQWANTVRYSFACGTKANVATWNPKVSQVWISGMCIRLAAARAKKITPPVAA